MGPPSTDRATDPRDGDRQRQRRQRRRRHAAEMTEPARELPKPAPAMRHSGADPAYGPLDADLLWRRVHVKAQGDELVQALALLLPAHHVAKLLVPLQHEVERLLFLPGA